MLTYLPHTPGSDHSARSLALKRLWVCCAIRSILTAYSLGINKTHQLLPFFLTPETEIRVEGWRKMAHYHGDHGKVSYPVLREGENRQTYRHLQGMSLPTHEFLFSCHAKGQFTSCLGIVVTLLCPSPWLWIQTRVILESQPIQDLEGQVTSMG